MSIVAHVNRKKFFEKVRPILGGRLTQGQVEGLNRILDYAEKRKFYVWDQFAGILMQAYLESGHTFQPVREAYYMGQPKQENYLKTKKYYPWVGEGLVQVTWEANHKKFGATAPGQMMTWDKALPALFDGMLHGMFTGRKLDDYFHGPEEARVQDWSNQRAIVNPKDYKTYPIVAEGSKKFYHALLDSLEPGAGTMPTAVVADKDAKEPPPIQVADKEEVDVKNPPPIAPQPPPEPSLLRRIFANFGLDNFKRS